MTARLPCQHVTLKALPATHAPGLTLRSALEKLGAIQMLDVHFPTTDERRLVFVRHTNRNLTSNLS
jgi:hypothetical protein